MFAYFHIRNHPAPITDRDPNNNSSYKITLFNLPLSRPLTCPLRDTVVEACVIVWIKSNPKCISGSSGQHPWTDTPFRRTRAQPNNLEIIDPMAGLL